MVDPERTKKQVFPEKKSSFKLKTSTWILIFIFAIILLGSIVISSLYNDDEVANDDSKIVKEKPVKEAKASSSASNVSSSLDDSVANLVNTMMWLIPISVVFFMVANLFLRRSRW